MEKAKLEKLKAMYALACELTREPDKQIDGNFTLFEPSWLTSSGIWNHRSFTGISSDQIVGKASAASSLRRG